MALPVQLTESQVRQRLSQATEKANAGNPVAALQVFFVLNIITLNDMESKWSLEGMTVCRSSTHCLWRRVMRKRLRPLLTGVGHTEMCG